MGILGDEGFKIQSPTITHAPGLSRDYRAAGAG
jgi:hypothetical protein